jgi:serine/threonine protein kinase/tetratricopeptide (TPR) repeat protein
MSAEEALLEELVFQVLERHASGDSSALDELCVAYPARAAQLRARVESLARSGLMAERDELPETLGEFRVVRRLGQGGMGVVLLAEQPRLGRRVALKMVRPEQLYFRGARERFQREVEAVARLSHPGIVPIFTVGDASGAPFYAMELIVGASLHDVLVRLRERDRGELSGAALRESVAAIARERGFEVGPEGAGDPLFALNWNDACAWLAREVAQALEHAHQRGVLHRDVKPSNILITAGGRVLLTDFGLAASAGDERITRHGAQLGSLAYMAPEQSSGGAAALGPRADVYALGVTFYEALALELPWETSDASRVEGRQALALRRRRPQAPADFELVCATALESDPARRYASAAHFARDLSNLLQRRPIEARPVSLALAARRWSQRHPAGATALALLLVASVAGPLVYGAQASRARVLVAAERDTAQANLAAALDAIELTLEKVAHHELRDIPRVDAIKAQLLQRAGELYARLGENSAGNPEVELRAAKALGKLARLKRDTGDLAGAKEDFARAEQRMRALLAVRGDDARTLFALGNLLTFSTVLLHPASSPEAIETMQFALQCLRRASELEPEALGARHELARGLLGLAHLQDTLDRKADAEQSWIEAAEIAAPLQTAGLDANDGLELHLTAVGRLATLAQVRGDYDAVRDAMELILARSESVAQPSGFLRHLRAMSFETLAIIGPRADEADPAAQVARWNDAAHAEVEALASDHPRNDRYVSGLTISWMGRGGRAKDAGDAARAMECWNAAERACLRLAALAPNDPNAPLRLARIAHHRSDVERAAGRYEAARDRLVEARAHHLEAHRVARREIRLEEFGQVARSWVEVGELLGAHEMVAEGAADLLAYEPQKYPGSHDAARAYLLAHTLAASAGDDASSARHLDAARAAFERALDLDPTRRAEIAATLEQSGLDSSPGFAELFERASR